MESTLYSVHSRQTHNIHLMPQKSKIRIMSKEHIDLKDEGLSEWLCIDKWLKNHYHYPSL